MKIGIFKPWMSGPGGTETFLREVMKRLQDRHDITLVTDDSPLSKELDEMNINIYRLPMINRFYFLRREWFEIESLTLYASCRFKNIFKKIDADVWSTHYWLENLLLSRYLNTPNIFHFPGIKSPHLEWKIMAKFAKPDFYLASSQETARRAKKWLNIDCRGIVHTGVDINRFNPKTNPAFENDYLNIMFVGRLDSGKGLMDLVEAFRILRRKRDDIKLWLVGAGSLEKKLKSKVKKYNLDKSVVFTGKIERENIQRWYSACDIFCLPSYHEGFPLVNLEAMASGKPIVTSDLKATREQINDEVEGFFFEVGNVNELSNKIEYLLNNPKVRKKMGEEGRKKSKRFSWKKQARKMEDFYKKCFR